VTARAERLFVVSLGQRVRFLRGLRGLTTRQLAERAGMAPATVNAIELGVRAPSVVYVFRLAAALRVPWVALAEKGQEDAARQLREALEVHGPVQFPPSWSPLVVDRAEGLPS
jgi:transcriptional regulator with XRE-family HTH domain